MAGLAAGQLDRRVRIEVATTGDDGMNEIEVFEPLATVWARYVPARGQEAREQMGRDVMMTASFHIRWSQAVAPLLSATGRFRLRYPGTADGQAWDIKSAVEIGRCEGIEIIAFARQVA